MTWKGRKIVSSEGAAVLEMVANVTTVVEAGGNWYVGSLPVLDVGQSSLQERVWFQAQSESTRTSQDRFLVVGCCRRVDEARRRVPEALRCS